jgi:SAM-dependent methyltransferase
VNDRRLRAWRSEAIMPVVAGAEHAGGSYAPDGSPVDFYSLLPNAGEAEIIHAALPSGCAILELGCGAGRMTRRLLELGHPVVAVDNSPEMLAHVEGAETILSDIESLDLGRELPAVILASYLVNTTDFEQRRAFLDTCARHVTADGSVLIQRAHPDLGWKGRTFHESTIGAVRIRTRVMEWDGNAFHAVGEYAVGDRVWTQEYRSELLDDDAIRASLAASGLSVHRWLDERREWLEARRGD